MSPRLTFVVDVASFRFTWPAFAEDAAPASEAALLQALEELSAARRSRSVSDMTVSREPLAASGPRSIGRCRDRHRS